MSPAPVPFEQAALAGDLTLTLQMGLLTGTLWAIGSGWATAIRNICVEVAKDSPHMWVAELVAALLTTAAGSLLAINVKRIFAAPRIPARILGRPQG